MALVRFTVGGGVQFACALWNVTAFQSLQAANSVRFLSLPGELGGGGTVGLMVGLLGAGIKKRERKVVPS